MTDLFATQRLDRKVLIVTGSTQGLGAAIARRVAGLGASGIVVCGRDRGRGAAVANELRQLGTDALFVGADLDDVDSTRGTVRACDEHVGRLDGLVNAAGLSTRGTIDDTTVELWDRLFAVTCGRRFCSSRPARRSCAVREAAPWSTSSRWPATAASPC
jgi:NAD(P)-dependent dehydrogenase (short-subunit alcohol dehydrogenase family)